MRDGFDGSTKPDLQCPRPKAVTWIFGGLYSGIGGLGKARGRTCPTSGPHCRSANSNSHFGQKPGLCFVIPAWIAGIQSQGRESARLHVRQITHLHNRKLTIHGLDS
jgi:hypothetical protein